MTIPKPNGWAPMKKMPAYLTNTHNATSVRDRRIWKRNGSKLNTPHIGQEHYEPRGKDCETDSIAQQRHREFRDTSRDDKDL
jgi:hypothetical protein